MATECWKAAGLPYSYDIDVCAPTILLSLGERTGMSWLIAEPIKNYLTDKAAFRERLHSR